MIIYKCLKHNHLTNLHFKPIYDKI